MSKQNEAVDDSRTVDKETFAQILEAYDAYRSGCVDELDAETDDFENLEEIDSELFGDEYTDEYLVDQFRDISGFELVLTVKSGAKPEWNDPDNRAILNVYHIGSDLYFVDNDFYHDRFSYFCREDFLTSWLIGGVEDNHFEFVEFAYDGDLDDALETTTKTEIAEEVVSELKKRWTQRLN
jgi:hypothetical protein